MNPSVLQNESQSMKRTQRLASFWAWLPAFRAVGETQHLPSASKALLVSAPALSRTIKLLERDLSVKLFERSGRKIVLTREGEELLTATRDAMRLIHDTVESISDKTPHDSIRIMSAGAITSTFLLPAIETMREEHPELVPAIFTTDHDVVPRLLRGDLDIALQSRAIHSPKVTTTHLGTIRSSVYCGEGHPLYRKRTLKIAQVLHHPFVGPVPNDLGQVEDGWPPHHQRNFGTHVDQMRLGRAICARGKLLAVLPDTIANSSSLPKKLWRLPLDDLIPATNLFAIHRKVLGKRDIAMKLLAHLQRQISSCSELKTSQPQ